MSRKNIAAFTATTSSMPDFVSVNQEGEDRVSIAVRCNAGQSHATVVMAVEDFDQLADAVAAWRAQR